MTDLAVPWGSNELNVKLPDQWDLTQVASSSLRAASDDWPDRMAMSLNQPEGCQPLSRLLAARRNGRICIIVEDLTRHSPLPRILTLILREIKHANIKDSQIEIVFATGMHPPLTRMEAVDKLGVEAATLAFRSNPWTDRKAYVKVGKVQGLDIAIDKQVASADLRIIVSSVSPHLQAGFGGGYKMLLPGCAAIDTIRGLHKLGIGRTPRQLVGLDVTKNPMRQVIDAGGELVDQAGGKTFVVQYLLDALEQPCVIATGEPLPAQRMLAKQAAVSCGVILPTSADVLITNAYPRDMDLWQSFKCVANTLWAARPGGVIICLTRCLSGLNGMKPPPWPLSQKATRNILRVLGPGNLASLIMRLSPRLAGDAGFFIRMAAAALHRNPILMVSPQMAAAEVKFPGVPIFAEPQQAIEVAQGLLGSGRQRAIVFPHGGITYPVPFRNGASQHAQ